LPVGFSAELGLGKGREVEPGRIRLSTGADRSAELGSGCPGSDRSSAVCSGKLFPGKEVEDELAGGALSTPALSFRTRTGIRLFSMVAVVRLRAHTVCWKRARNTSTSTCRSATSALFGLRPVSSIRPVPASQPDQSDTHMCCAIAARDLAASFKREADMIGARVFVASGCRRSGGLLRCMWTFA